MKAKSNVEPPTHLSPRSCELWRQVAGVMKTAGRLTLLQCALEALDDADEARVAVKAAGMTSATASTGAVHVHPAVKIEREARAQFLKIWTGLSLQKTSAKKASSSLKFFTDEE